MKSDYLFIEGGKGQAWPGAIWRSAGIADKGLLLNLGCSNQAQPFSRRVPAESSDLMQRLDCFTVFFGRWISKNVLSLKGRQSLKVVEQDYGLGPLFADINSNGKKNRS